MDVMREFLREIVMAVPLMVRRQPVKTYSCIIFLLFFAAFSASAQSDISNPIDNFGRIFSPTSRPEALSLAIDVLDDDDPSYRVVALSGRDSDSSTNGSIMLGYGTKVGQRDVFFSGSYTRVGPDAGDGSNRFVGYGETSLFALGQVNFGANAAIVYDPDSFRAFNPILGAERRVYPSGLQPEGDFRKVSLVGNLGWIKIDPDGGDSVDAVQPAVGLAFTLDRAGRWDAGFDYTFDNDADGEDTGSVAVSRKFPTRALKLKLTAEKHGVFGLSLSRVF
jgi:hypothetical protein